MRQPFVGVGVGVGVGVVSFGGVTTGGGTFPCQIARSILSVPLFSGSGATPSGPVP